MPDALHCVVIDCAPGRKLSPDAKAAALRLFEPDRVLFMAVVKPDITVLIAFWIVELGGTVCSGCGDGFVGLAHPVATASTQTATMALRFFICPSKRKYVPAVLRPAEFSFV